MDFSNLLENTITPVIDINRENMQAQEVRIESLRGLACNMWCLLLVMLVMLVAINLHIPSMHHAGDHQQ